MWWSFYRRDFMGDNSTGGSAGEKILQEIRKMCWSLHFQRFILTRDFSFGKLSTISLIYGSVPKKAFLYPHYHCIIVVCFCLCYYCWVFVIITISLYPCGMFLLLLLGACLNASCQIGIESLKSCLFQVAYD